MYTKTLLFFLLFIITAPVAFAQRADTAYSYLDYYEKPVQRETAIYDIKIYKQQPGDLLYRWEKHSHFEDKLLAEGWSKDPQGTVKQGDFLFYNLVMPEKTLSEQGRYENNKKEGLWTTFSETGKPLSKFNFSNDHLAGLSMGWYESGKLLDSFALDKSGTGMGYGYYEDGNKRYDGKFSEGKKQGRWSYYYDLPRYPRSMEVMFEADSLISSNCFTINGDTQKLNCVYEREALFLGGDKVWQRYLAEELSSTSFAKHMKGQKFYEVIVRFMIAKDGSVTDVQIENSGNRKLDKIAESVIRKSPPWYPAIEYNQPVNAYRRQPITFAVEYE